MSAPYAAFSVKETSQTEPIPFREDQVRNNAGGYVFSTGPWQAFLRFLIMGTESGTYYVAERPLTVEGAQNTICCLQEDPKRAIDLIVEVSSTGRAAKNDPALFALALGAASPDVGTRRLALAALPRVARIPTHLFHFLTYAQNQRGWGRAFKKGVQDWFTHFSPEALAYEFVKYQARDGWSNRDVLRLAHPKNSNAQVNAIYKWAVSGECTKECPEIIQRFLEAQAQSGETKIGLAAICKLIVQHNLAREMVPTWCLKYPDAWEALLERMPPTALLRNLGNMSKVGLLRPLSDASRAVCDKLGDKESLKRGRVHPMAVLIANKTYASGSGLRGDGKWEPVPAVLDALDSAFYSCFHNVVPTGKRLLIAIDMSGSMKGSAFGRYASLPDIAGTKVHPCEAAAAMALACAKSEKDYYIMGFADQFRSLGITAKTSLREAVAATQARSFEPTDCALPWTWALDNKVTVDACITLTDNETWAGPIHPTQALQRYRDKTGIAAKAVAIGLTATDFSILDPKDAGSLNVAGFDAAAPAAIAEFIRG